MSWPASKTAGPLFVMARSACAVTGVVTDALSFAPFVSVAAEETEAVFVIDAPAKAAGTLNVAVIVFCSPAFSVPMLQGNGVVHGPAFEAKVRPGGVGSLTTTVAAAEGPRLDTVMV